MSASVLVVAVRGWTTSGEIMLGRRPGGELRRDFLDALAASLPDTEVWAPDLDLAMFSMRSAESLAQELFRAVTTKMAESVHIERIVLLGYSTGSVLARRLFCIAHGAAEDGTVSGPRAAWADKIDRVVMLAGITRGWEFSSASPAHVRFLGPILYRIAAAVGWWKRRSAPVESTIPLIYQMKRGSPFVVATRIQYVKVFERLRQRMRGTSGSTLRVDGLPSTIFLVGAKDEFISPADCTELGPRIEFAFVELPGSNHADAVQIGSGTPEAEERKQRLLATIAQDFTSLTRRPWAIPAADIDDYLDPMDIADEVTGRAASGADVGHAVMVVHGIRDHGFWTKRVAREIKTLGRESRIIVRAPTPSYGYFSMWDFVRPGGRDQAVFWFMERYADVKSHFPHARISFVGHSNGTYLAARALELCPAISFESIVFAGSVVRRDFCWTRFPGRVRRVLNYVGTGDGVVAFLPAVFEFLSLRWLDVGGAGAFGFKNAEPPPAVAKRLLNTESDDIELSEFRYVRGGHGAAIAESFWPEIARFTLLGTPPGREPVIRRGNIRLLFRCAPVITTVGAVLAVMLVTLPLTAVALTTRWVGTHPNPSALTIVATIMVLVASLLVSWFVGRFVRMW